jgi:hypothetical protein
MDLACLQINFRMRMAFEFRKFILRGANYSSYCWTYSVALGVIF